MASAQAAQHLRSQLFCKNYDHDPGATTAILASPDGGTTPVYVDLRDYHNVLVGYRPTIVAAGGVTLVRVMASSDVLGASNATEVVTSGAVAGDSLNDNVWLEVTSEQVAALAAAAGVELRYLTFAITHATNTDEGNLTVIAVPRTATKDLTATVIT
jgi:NADPH-dependent glutamate synthase beta subunit-like oxidoreductase